MKHKTLAEAALKPQIKLMLTKKRKYTNSEVTKMLQKNLRGVRSESKSNTMNGVEASVRFKHTN